MQGLSRHALETSIEEDVGPFLGPHELKAAREGTIWWPGASYQQVASASLVAASFKKFQDGATREAGECALRTFLSVNRLLADVTLPTTELDYQIDGDVKVILDRWWENCRSPEHPYDFLSRGTCGPGASVGATGTSHYAKMFAGPLTCTSESHANWYARYLRGHPESSIAELIRALNHGPPLVARGNKLHLVPKTTKTMRVICVEPSLNMFYQQGLRFYLEKGLNATFGIDLSHQADRNRRLARLGSLDGSIATIDLSSASDSLSLAVCRRLMPPAMVRWLEWMRSAETQLPSGEWVALNMVSSMGNAFTFPLQTGFFASVVQACGLAASQPLSWSSSDHRAASVFGDDIACPSRIAGLVCRTLERYGFRVNASKTFVEGLFRESCGHDYFCGRPVRGVYIKTLTKRNSAHLAFNRLVEWSAQTGIPVRHSLTYLIGKGEFLPVPMWDQVDAGYRVPIECITPKRSKSGSYRYKRFEPQTIGYRMLASDLRPPPGHKRLIYNPPGLLQSVLRGEWNDGRLLVRHTGDRIVTRWRVAPNWEYSSTSPQGDTRLLTAAFLKSIID